MPVRDQCGCAPDAAARLTGRVYCAEISSGGLAMLLIGMFDSPFVRRVAISLDLLGYEFEHANWSVGADFARIREYSALGRVPALVLDDGEVLTDSAAILEYLDGDVGPERALLPVEPVARRRARHLMALAMAAAEKGRDQIYERVFRPAEKRHAPWIERCRAQMHDAVAEIEAQLAGTRTAGTGIGDTPRSGSQWLFGDRIGQADISVTCAITFLCDSVDLRGEMSRYPALAAHVDRCEALDAFRATHVPWNAPAN